MTDDHDQNGSGSERTYEVGYGRPPKSSQFKSGQSGNPSGRKRKPKTAQAQMRAALDRKVTIMEGGVEKRLSLLEVMLRTIANMAAKGDLKAAAFVFNLLNTPETTQADSIDASTLSADDQALLNQIMDEFSGAGGAETPTQKGDDGSTEGMFDGSGVPASGHAPDEEGEQP